MGKENVQQTTENKGKSKKKGFKTPNTYVIIFVVLLLVAILTWLIPGGEYQLDADGNAISGTYTQITSNPQGLWNVIMAPIIGMVGNESISGAIAISLNVMIFGSFLEMMNRSGVINVALGGVAEKFKDNMNVLIIALTFIMGLFGTVQGAYEEGFVYLLMFTPIVLSLGLDTVVALMIVILGTQGGCIASIVNPFSTGIAAGIVGISPGDGIIFRAIIFVVMMSFISALIIFYAKKVAKDPSLSTQYHRREADHKEFLEAGENEGQSNTLNSGQRKVLVCFILTFVIMIIGLVPWTSLNPNWTFFEDAVTWLGNIPVVGGILGSDITPLGDWYFDEINGLLIVMTFLSGHFMKYSVDKSINIFIKGASDLVSTAFIIPLARGIQVIMTNANITATVLHFCEESLGALSPLVFVIIALLLYLVMASFIPSSTGLAAATMAIMGPLGEFAGIGASMMIVIYNMALGIVKMIMPTSIIVMTCTQAVNVSYTDWIKSTWKIALFILLMCIAILLIGVSLGV